MNSSTLKILSLSMFATLVAFPVLCPTQADGAVIVLKNGEVLVGRIREDEVDEEKITMRWPYKERTDRGEIDVPMYRVRWHDLEADEPTDAYWEEFGDRNIDGEWLHLYEKWKLRNQGNNNDLEGLDLLRVDAFLSSASLSPIPVENSDFRIQKPEGWTSSVDENGITIFVSDKSGTEGFRGRIHVFAVKSAIGGTEEQVGWIEKEIAKLAKGSGSFEVREKKRPRARASGFDLEMLTLTTRFERPVVAMRKLMFRKKKTYFFTAYAHERDYGGLEGLFKACMHSLELKEDMKKDKRKRKRRTNRPGRGAGSTSRPSGG